MEERRLHNCALQLELIDSQVLKIQNCGEGYPGEVRNEQVCSNLIYLK